MGTSSRRRSGPQPGPSTEPIARSFDAIGAGLPSLSDEQRQAFRSLVPDLVCDSLGNKTKAERVLNEVDNWIVLIDSAFRSHPQELKRYSLSRFAWLVLCVRELKEAICLADEKKEQIQQARICVEDFRKQARLVRDDLTRTLLSLAGADSQGKAHVLQACGNLEKGDEALIESVHRLVLLAEQWLNKTDPISKILVESKSLSAADVQKASQCADMLALSIQKAKLSGRIYINDSPEINRIEGRVLVEMKEAKRVFDAAHEQNKLVPRLIPGPGTQRVLVRHSKKPSKPAPKGPPVTAPAASTTPAKPIAASTQAQVPIIVPPPAPAPAAPPVAASSTALVPNPPAGTSPPALGTPSTGTPSTPSSPPQPPQVP